MEVMLVADHLYLQKFNTDKEATEILLTLAHMVRKGNRYIWIYNVVNALQVTRLNHLFTTFQFSEVKTIYVRQE